MSSAFIKHISLRVFAITVASTVSKSLEFSLFQLDNLQRSLIDPSRGLSHFLTKFPVCHLSDQVVNGGVSKFFLQFYTRFPGRIWFKSFFFLRGHFNLRYSYETSVGWYTYFKTSLQPLTILRHLRSLEPKYKYGGVMFSLLFSTNVILSTDVISSTGPQRVYSHSFLENGIHTGGPVASVASSYSSWGSTSITGLDTSELSASSSCSDLSEISSSSEVGNIFFTSS